MKRGGDCAQKGAHDESGVEEEQETLAVETISKPRRQDGGDARAESVGRYHEPELGGRDLQRWYEHGAQRRHHHEVQDDGKLQEGHESDDEPLIARESALGLRLGHVFAQVLAWDWPGVGLGLAWGWPG